jgi:5-methylcytosine-specific restriction protein A
MPWRAPTDSQLRHSRRQTDQRYNAARRAQHGPDPRSTARWRRVRARQLARQPLCEGCRAQGRTEAATQVDHIQGVWEAPERVFDETNLQSLCSGCHSCKSAAERQG